MSLDSFCRIEFLYYISIKFSKPLQIRAASIFIKILAILALLLDPIKMTRQTRGRDLRKNCGELAHLKVNVTKSTNKIFETFSRD